MLDILLTVGRAGLWGVQRAQPLQSMGLKKNYSSIVLLSTTLLIFFSLFTFSLIPRVPAPSLHQTFLFFFPDLISFSSFVVLF